MMESYVVLRKYDSCQEERKLEEEANWDWIFELYRINKSDDLEFLETFSNT